MPRMTDEQLTQIEARANAATKGEWHTTHGCVESRNGETITLFHWPNAVFIANAKQDVPALIAEVRESRERIAQLENRIANQRREIRFQRIEVEQTTKAKEVYAKQVEDLPVLRMLKHRITQLEDALVRRSGAASAEELSAAWNPTEESAAAAVVRLSRRVSQLEAREAGLREALVAVREQLARTWKWETVYGGHALLGRRAAVVLVENLQPIIDEALAATAAPGTEATGKTWREYVQSPAGRAEYDAAAKQEGE